MENFTRASGTDLVEKINTGEHIFDDLPAETRFKVRVRFRVQNEDSFSEWIISDDVTTPEDEVESTIGPFYRRSASRPSPPAAQSDSSTPAGWSGTAQVPTDDGHVWQITGRRFGSTGDYLWTMTLYAPAGGEVESTIGPFYRRSASRPSPPAAQDNADTPAGWSPTAQVPTDDGHVWQITGRRFGSTGDYLWTMTLYAPAGGEVESTIGPFYRRSASRPSPPAAQDNADTPAGWSPTAQVPTDDGHVWQITGRRFGSTGDYLWTLTLYAPAGGEVESTIGPFYQRSATRPSPPAAQDNADTPAGWSPTAQVPTDDGHVWQITGRRFGSTGDYLWTMTLYAPAGGEVESTIGPFYRRSASRPSPPAAQSDSSTPAGWSGTAQVPTDDGHVWQITGRRFGSTGDYLWTLTLYAPAGGEVESTIGPFYRRSASRPSPPAAQSDSSTPAGWSGTAQVPTATDHVWQITGRRFGSTGDYLWTMTLYAPAGGEVESTIGPFYQRSATRPSPPAAQDNADTPAGWSPTAQVPTDDGHVWQITGRRFGSTGDYLWTLTLYAPAGGEVESTIGPFYQRSATRPSPPAAQDNADTPAGWSPTAQVPTDDGHVWQITGRRFGSTGDYLWTMTLYAPAGGEVESTIGPFYRRSASRPSPPAAQSDSSTPAGWSGTAQVPTATDHVWQITGRRFGSTGDYLWTMTLYAPAGGDTAQTIGPFYQRSASRPSPPAAQSDSSTPTGWSASELTATSTDNVWQITGRRFGDSGNYQWIMTLFSSRLLTEEVAEWAIVGNMALIPDSKLTGVVDDVTEAMGVLTVTYKGGLTSTITLPTGGLGMSQVQALIASWAQTGNVALIPKTKLPGDTVYDADIANLLSQSQVQGLIADWAETGNLSLIPEAKLPDIGGLSQSEVDARISTWARPGTPLSSSGYRIPVAKLPTNVVYSADITNFLVDSDVATLVAAVGVASGNLRITRRNGTTYDLTLPGGLTQAQVDARANARISATVERWAQVDTATRIPAVKLPSNTVYSVASGGPVKSVVASTSNSDPIGTLKITNWDDTEYKVTPPRLSSGGGGLTEAQVDARANARISATVETWAQIETATKIPSAKLPGGIVTGLSLSGSTLTVTKNDGTTGTITLPSGGGSGGGGNTGSAGSHTHSTTQTNLSSTTDAATGTSAAAPGHTHTVENATAGGTVGSGGSGVTGGVSQIGSAPLDQNHQHSIPSHTHSFTGTAHSHTSGSGGGHSHAFGSHSHGFSYNHSHNTTGAGSHLHSY